MYLKYSNFGLILLQSVYEFFVPSPNNMLSI